MWTVGVCVSVRCMCHAHIHPPTLFRTGTQICPRELCKSVEINTYNTSRTTRLTSDSPSSSSSSSSSSSESSTCVPFSAAVAAVKQVHPEKSAQPETRPEFHVSTRAYCLTVVNFWTCVVVSRENYLSCLVSHNLVTQWVQLYGSLDRLLFLLPSCASSRVSAQQTWPPIPSFRYRRSGQADLIPTGNPEFEGDPPCPGFCIPFFWCNI